MSLTDFTIKSNLTDYDVIYQDFGSLSTFVNSKNDFLIVDEIPFKLFSEKFTEVLPVERIIIVKAVEKNKTLDHAMVIIKKIMKSGITKRTRILAVGGGIIQDLAGFIASILYRGISWYFFPTTLLAQADSCIGAKTSINFGAFKNLIGTFYNPTKVIISTGFLKSLNQRDYFSGIGEIVKLHIIGGPEKIDTLIQEKDKLLERNLNALSQVINTSLQIKKSYIEKDEFDQNIRNLLNYGHCIGHAIEFSTKFKIPHGQAVTIGIILANRISVSRGELKAITADRLECELLNHFVDVENLSIKLKLAEIISAMKRDKKRVGENLVVIWYSDKGEVFKFDDVTIKEVEDVIAEWNTRK